MARPLSIHHLSLLDCPIPEFITAASEAGFNHICGFGCAWPTDDFVFPLLHDPAILRETRAALRDTHMSVYSINAPFIHPDVDIESYRGSLELAASLGTKQATAVIGDDDISRAADNIAKLRELALPLGICPDIEFMKLSYIQSMNAAVKLAQAAGHLHQSIAIDMLHLIRTGGTAEDIAKLDPQMIGNVQISDGPLFVAEDQQVDEAMYNRLLPGEGEFPLADIVKALPADLVISVEAPTNAARRQGETPKSWAKKLYDAARRAAP